MISVLSIVIYLYDIYETIDMSYPLLGERLIHIFKKIMKFRFKYHFD